MKAGYLSPARRKELELVLPEMAFIDNEGHHRGPDGPPQVIAVKRFESGYYPIYTRAKAADLNKSRRVTDAQREAMYAGSCFGWDVPAADPASWERALAAADEKAKELRA